MNEETKPPHMTRHEQSRDESIKENSGPVATGGDATINDRIGLFLAICAFGFSLLAMGMEVNRTLSVGNTQRLQEQAIDAKIQAGIESAKAAMQQQVSDAKASANDARINARVSLDKIEEVRYKLADKGIHIKLDGH